jgi:hypothetical protein
MSAPSKAFDDREQAQRTLASRLTLLTEADGTPLIGGIDKYAQSILDDREPPPYYIGELEAESEKWVFVLHGNGLELFRPVAIEGLGSATLERKTIPPLWGATLREEIRMTGDNLRQSEMRLTRPKIESAIVLIERLGSDPGDAALASVASLMREWARIPAPPSA